MSFFITDSGEPVIRPFSHAQKALATLTAAALFGSLLVASAAAPAFATSAEQDAPPSAAGLGPVLSGSVTTDAGDAAAGIAVRAYRDSETEPVETTTDASGAFAFQAAELPTGSYSVEFADTSGLFATEWWQDAATRTAAEPVVVDSAESSYLVATVSSGASTGAEAVVETPAEPSPAPTTEPSAVPSAEPTDQATTKPSAKPVDPQNPVNTPAPVPDAEQPPATQAAVSPAEISGTVTNVAGEGIEGAQIYAYLESDEPSNPTFVQNAYSDESGAYVISDLVAGNYTLEFNAPGFIREWWDNAASVDKATFFTVAAGSSTTNNAALTIGATISGTVTDSSGTGIEGAYVTAYLKSQEDSSLISAGGSSTDESGAYSITSLASGSYTLEFQASGHLAKWWDNAATASDATFLSVAAGASATNKNAVLATGATISGTVTNAAGTGIDGARVTAYLESADSSSPEWKGSASTDESGAYSIGELAAGDYTLEFSASGHLSEWWGNVASSDLATYFAVSTGTATVKDAALATGATISGTVTNAAGAAIEGAWIYAYSESENPSNPTFVGNAYSDESGAYSIGELSAGRYTLQFSASGHVPQWWGNAASSDSAAYFALGAGDLTIKDAALTTGATISGTVTNAAGAGIKGAHVTAYTKSTGDSWLTSAGESSTDKSGAYSITALAPGSYTLHFRASGHLAEWWSNVATSDAATYFTLVDGSTTTKNSVLATGATISGIVTNSSGVAIDGARVDAYLKATDSHNWVGSADTDKSGKYSIGELAAGSYTLEFSAPGHVAEWWSNVASSSTATYFTLAAGASTTKSAGLATGATISGTVKDSSGAAIQGANVVAYLKSTGSSSPDWAGSSVTDASGNYSIGELAAGSYTLQFRAPAHVAEWWSNVTSYEAATYFSLAAGASTTNKNAALETGATISGTVTNSSGEGIEEVNVTAFLKTTGSSSENWAGSSSSDASGTYSIGDLAAGSYTLQFSAPGFVTHWWEGAATSDTATYFTVDAGAASSKDATLTTGATIAGTVTKSGGTGLKDLYVVAYQKSTGGVRDWAGSAYTDASGKYSISSLAAGNYTLEIGGNSSYASEWWNDAESFETATYFELSSGESTTKNVALAPAATISGTVTNSSGIAISGVSVYASQKNGSSGGGVTTNSSGAYSIKGLAAGSYTLSFNKAGYVGEWWSNTPSWQNATYFGLTAGASTTKDAVLAKGATISGVVKSSAGTGVKDVSVTAYLKSPTSSNPNYARSATTDASGKYSIGELAAGSYTLQFRTSSNYVAEWWSDADSFEKATYFTLAAGASTTKDAALMKGATISGTVRDSSGVALAGVWVNAQSKTPGLYGGATTDAAGKYSITGLRAGSYTLQFNGNSSNAPEWWSNATSPDAATYFALAAGAATTKDAALVKGATISGTVKDAAGAVLEGVRVSAQSKTGLYGSAMTDAAGKYSITGLAVGSYTLSFYASGYAGEWWSNAASFEKASYFAVAASASTVKDAALAAGATITGVVKNSAGKGIPGVYVRAHVKGADGQPVQVNGGSTDSAGKYSIVDLAAGSYTLEFRSDTYAREWWSNAESSAKASYFALVAGASTAKNADLGTGGSLSGTVTGKSGSTIKPTTAKIEVYNATGQLVATEWAYSAGIDAAKYTVSGLKAGNYRLKYTSYSGFNSSSMVAGPFITEYWNNKSTLASANVVAVTAGKTKTGVNVELAQKLALTAATPKVTGTPLTGQTLKASTGTWTSGTTFTYQWLADGKAISGATKWSFKITSAQKGQALSVTVTGAKTNYVTASKTSAKTAKVAR